VLALEEDGEVEEVSASEWGLETFYVEREAPPTLVAFISK
jgi:hypothetical protein